MKPKVVACILIIIVSTGLAATVLSTIRAQESQPHYKVYNHREWYLQSLWQVQQQAPDNFVLPILFGLSDTYIRNYVIPNTGEDFQTAKTRISSALGPNPSDIEVHTAIVLESYATGSCSGARDGQCYLLTITHWAIAAQILGPLAGATVSYDTVTANDYTPEWAAWNIPRPSVTGMPQPPPAPSFPTTLNSGTHEVGKQIAVGLYRGTVTQRGFVTSCAWKRWRKNGNAEYEAELDIHFGVGYQFYVRVLETDYKLETDCQLNRVTDFTRPASADLANTIEPGMYLVGVEVKPGIYEGVVSSENFSSCTWARHADFTGAFNERIDTGFHSDEGTSFSVLVAPGDYGFATSCRLTFVQ